MIEPNPKLNKGFRILLIEDDTSYARLVALMLQGADALSCAITHCTTLREGRRELENGAGFDAVLLDLSLPDSQGFDTLKQLIVHYPHLNIIVMTGQDDKNWGIQAVKSGAQDFLVKGDFDGDALARALRYSIERSNILKRLEETQRLAHIGHWECSPLDHYFQASEEVYRIFGLSHHRTFSCQELLDPECPFHLFLQLQEVAVQKGEARRDTWIKRQDGKLRYVAMACTLGTLHNGHVLHNGVIQDITERKQAQEMRKARDLAQHAAKVREQFIADVSHEMRTPMNAILGMANLLMQTRLDEEQDSYIHAIKHSSEILLGIINDILYISSIRNEKLQFEKKNFNLLEVLNKAFGVLRYKAEEKGLHFVLEAGPGIPEYLQGDALRLSQILYNLLGNAIKFTEEGFVRLSVVLLKRGEGHHHLQFEIADSGIGIEPSQLDLIFEAFTRVNQDGLTSEGTGLGLPITKNLVDAQGGKISATSQPGKGSTFRFSLWFDEGSPPVEPVVVEPDLLPSDVSFRLLLVEDHAMNRLVAKKTLEKKWKNIEIFVASNGDEAIELLKKEKVDIILMDIRMPLRDGFSTTRHIRNELPPEVAQTPILAMTAHVDVMENQLFREYGMDDYVLKPFEPEQLFKKIQLFLGQKH